MLAKEINAVLADDKQRELWLKRFLPGLVVTVIYFVFVSSHLTEKAGKAEDAYMALVRQGVDEQRVAGLRERNSALREQLDALQRKDQALQKELSVKAGFLYGAGNEFEAIESVQQLMKRHGLNLAEFPLQPPRKVGELPKSVGDLKKWLSDMLNKNDTVRVYHFVFSGNYLNVYETLKDMAISDVKALPLALTMKDADEKLAARGYGKIWTLDLWI